MRKCLFCKKYGSIIEKDGTAKNFESVLGKTEWEWVPVEVFEGWFHGFGQGNTDEGILNPVAIVEGESGLLYSVELNQIKFCSQP